MRQGAKMTALTPQPFETSEKNTKSAAEQSPICLALKIVVSLRSRLRLFFATPQTAREQALFFAIEKSSGFAYTGDDFRSQPRKRDESGASFQKRQERPQQPPTATTHPICFPHFFPSEWRAAAWRLDGSASTITLPAACAQKNIAHNSAPETQNGGREGC